MTTHPPALMPTERGTAVENESERDMTGPEQMAARALSETTDPTTGERCLGTDCPGCAAARRHYKATGCTKSGCIDAHPAEPDAGDVEALNIIFDGPPSHESGRFVEVETDDGRSIRAGKWIQRNDGLWALRIDLDAVRQNAADDRAEQIAQAIEAARDVSQAPNYRAGFDVAARIARETR